MNTVGQENLDVKNEVGWTERLQRLGGSEKAQGFKCAMKTNVPRSN